MDKDSMIRKYAKSSKTPLQFDADISRYRVQQSEINGETSTHVINFVRIDCNTMKDALIAHCLQTQGKLTGLLNANGLAELSDIYDMFSAIRAKLTATPTTLEDLKVPTR
jgi:hypothetical protein